MVTAVAGSSKCTPGVVNVMQLFVDPVLASTLSR